MISFLLEVFKTEVHANDNGASYSKTLSFSLKLFIVLPSFATTQLTPVCLRLPSKNIPYNFQSHEGSYLKLFSHLLTSILRLYQQQRRIQPGGESMHRNRTQLHHPVRKVCAARVFLRTKSYTSKNPPREPIPIVWPGKTRTMMQLNLFASTVASWNSDLPSCSHLSIIVSCPSLRCSARCTILKQCGIGVDQWLLSKLLLTTPKITQLQVVATQVTTCIHLPLNISPQKQRALLFLRGIQDP